MIQKAIAKDLVISTKRFKDKLGDDIPEGKATMYKCCDWLKKEKDK